MEENEWEGFRFFELHGQTEYGNRTFQCTPENTELYIHKEQYAEVDHIFHRIDERDRRLGAFVWRSTLGEEQFEYWAEAMWDSGNWMIIYRPEPTEGDIHQYAKDHIVIPDEFNPEDFR